MRKLIVDNILYTDMAKHFAFMGELKALPSKEDYDPTSKHKPDILKALVHAADIGNAARPYSVCKEWTFRVLREFFAQGDKERALDLEISILCDRKTTNIGKSQIGFIDFVVFPYFDSLTKILPRMRYCIEELQANKDYWTLSVDDYEKQRLETGNEKI